MAKSKNVTDRVVAYLKEQILSGAWPLDSKLPSETELAAQLGCSRISVRSALQKFNAIGVIESVHGKGTYLRSRNLESMDAAPEAFSYAQLLELIDIIAMVWPGVCIRAAEQDNLELLSNLSAIVNQMRTLTPNQIPALAELVDSFHYQIALSLHNETLLRALSLVLTQLNRYPCTGAPTTVFYGNVYHHDLLLTAMQHRDPERIRLVMQDYAEHAKYNFYRRPDDIPAAAAGAGPENP